MEECSKTKNGKCGHNLECVYCPEIVKQNDKSIKANLYYGNLEVKSHREYDDDDADCCFD